VVMVEDGGLATEAVDGALVEEVGALQDTGAVGGVHLAVGGAHLVEGAALADQVDLVPPQVRICNYCTCSCLLAHGQELM